MTNTIIVRIMGHTVCYTNITEKGGDFDGTSYRCYLCCE